MRSISARKLWRSGRGLKSSRSDLLLGRRQREFAVADAPREAFGKLRGGLLPVGGHELGEGGEQASLRQTVAVHSFEPGLGPGVAQVAERRPLELVVPS